MDKKHKREARNLCLQILFANNFSDSDFDNLFSNFYLNKDNDLEKKSYNKKQVEYASRLYSFVIKEKDRVDKLIESKLVNWEMNRLATIDRIILRMAITEMLYLDDIPPKVSITEHLKSLDTTEGYFTVQAIHNIAQEKNIKMPIADSIYRILFEKVSIENEINQLLQRPTKDEVY